MTSSTSSNQPLRHHAQALHRHPNPERAGPLILPGLFIDMLDQTGTLPPFTELLLEAPRLTPQLLQDVHSLIEPLDHPVFGSHTDNHTLGTLIQLFHTELHGPTLSA